MTRYIPLILVWLSVFGIMSFTAYAFLNWKSEPLEWGVTQSAGFCWTDAQADRYGHMLVVHFRTEKECWARVNELHPGPTDED